MRHFKDEIYDDLPNIIKQRFDFINGNKLREVAGCFAEDETKQEHIVSKFMVARQACLGLNSKSSRIGFLIDDFELLASDVLPDEDNLVFNYYRTAHRISITMSAETVNPTLFYVAHKISKAKVLDSIVDVVSAAGEYTDKGASLIGLEAAKILLGSCDEHLIDQAETLLQ